MRNVRTETHTPKKHYIYYTCPSPPFPIQLDFFAVAVAVGLMPGDRTLLVRCVGFPTTTLENLDSNFTYPACRECRKKLSVQYKGRTRGKHERDDAVHRQHLVHYRCEACHDTEDIIDPYYRWRVKLRASDGCTIAYVVLFGSNSLNDIFGCTARQWHELMASLATSSSSTPAISSTSSSTSSMVRLVADFVQCYFTGRLCRIVCRPSSRNRNRNYGNTRMASDDEITRFADILDDDGKDEIIADTLRLVPHPHEALMPSLRRYLFERSSRDDDGEEEQNGNDTPLTMADSQYTVRTSFSISQNWQPTPELSGCSVNITQTQTQTQTQRSLVVDTLSSSSSSSPTLAYSFEDEYVSLDDTNVCDGDVSLTPTPLAVLHHDGLSQQSTTSITSSAAEIVSTTSAASTECDIDISQAVVPFTTSQLEMIFADFDLSQATPPSPSLPPSSPKTPVPSSVAIPATPVTPSSTVSSSSTIEIVPPTVKAFVPTSPPLDNFTVYCDNNNNAVDNTTISDSQCIAALESAMACLDIEGGGRRGDVDVDVDVNSCGRGKENSKMCIPETPVRGKWTHRQPSPPQQRRDRVGGGQHVLVPSTPE